MTFHLFSKIFSETLECRFLWQAQYLVRFDRDHICDEDSACGSFCLAGAVFGDAPCIVNVVSCVTRIKQANHFAWQAKCLVRLEGNTCCSAHRKGHLIRDEDSACGSFCVRGAVFGEDGS